MNGARLAIGWHTVSWFGRLSRWVFTAYALKQLRLGRYVYTASDVPISHVCVGLLGFVISLSVDRRDDYPPEGE